MLLSEVASTRQNLSDVDLNALPSFVPHVSIDPDYVDVDPPRGLTQIGLIADFNEEGQFSDNFVDIIISYGMAPTPISVLIEIPFRTEIGDLDRLLTSVQGIGASAIFLPPVSKDELEFEIYCEQMAEVARLFCSKVNFSTIVTPIGFEFQQMIAELIAPGLDQGKINNDYYFKKFFSDSLSEKEKKTINSAIRNQILESFKNDKGEDTFKDAMIGLCRKQIECLEEISQDMANVYSAKSKATK